jgi:NAD(P)-dependent dehydrogenase (short-subunit alcohol dehydrogenase family)
MTDLSGRRALVTGAGQGVGRGIALGLGAAGAAVVVNDLDLTRAESVAEEIAESGGRAVPAPFDVTDYAAVTAAVAANGPIDILVNNAGNAGVDGFGRLGSFADSEPADWHPFLAVNLYGVMNCTRAVLPGMIDRTWGRVITIVSDSGRTGGAGMAAYGAAKAGAAGLTRSLALETGRHGITVNNIALGTMRTEATEAFWADGDNPANTAILKGYPVRRPGSPDDVGPLVVFLADPETSWITGQTYPVNGGYSFSL